ncbi:MULTISPECIES: chemotaxis protein CheD [Exiguobacterium]|uniref:Probable chemoreceptor glutamine deamidase CheD n=1 Tax=Exiguobacterium antarcticum TaxID=132920 RepID=A0ABT6QYW5_9BACL|nr:MULTISPECIES: chemotaxis protein CheD [Exiguobacterium]AFS70813.1 Chemoreceptor glutamine deamidase CheD [Exiguobacterium antarcticum B7]MCT4779676.1 chemotaxis protein CheD [Exiguobacterium soli]MDI3233874.1 chemotaxis protein CheD [Exiguobacterium antarcticum]
MDEVVRIGIAEYAVSQKPIILRTAGLGSCVGVIIYDQERGLSSMAHVMLPDSAISRNIALEIGKFADTAVVELARSLRHKGAIRLRAKIAGGAQMFQFKYEHESMRIGERNIAAVRLALRKANVPLVAEDVGGTNGRTIEFHSHSGRLVIRTVNVGTLEI